MTIRQRQVIIKCFSFLITSFLYVFLLIALIRCCPKTQNTDEIAVGDCYERLGEYSILCVTKETRSFVELTDVYGNKRVLAKGHLAEEVYIKVNKK